MPKLKGSESINCPGGNLVDSDPFNFDPFNSGFTLIESLITLSIIAIISAFALPNIGSLGDAQRLKAAVRSLQSSLNFARSMAITHVQTITVCARDPESTQSKPQCVARQLTTSDWQNGWLVYQDENRNGQLDTTETLMRYQGLLQMINITSSAEKGIAKLSALGASVLSNQTWDFCLRKGLRNNSGTSQKAGLLRGYKLILSSPGLVRPLRIDSC